MCNWVELIAIYTGFAAEIIVGGTTDASALGIEVGR
jgi:hypothetical protein